MTMPYGYRLWMEGRSAPMQKARLNNTHAVFNLLNKIIDEAGMHLAAGPLTYKEPARDIGKGPGVTGVAILVESSVHVHTYPDQDFYFFELFSCKEFDHTTIVKAICEFMGKDDFEAEYVPVGEDFPDAV